MTCDRCQAEPCARTRAVKKLLGAWARERRRQCSDDIMGDLTDQASMDQAVMEPVQDVIEARCSCACHGTPKTSV